MGKKCMEFGSLASMLASKDRAKEKADRKNSVWKQPDLLALKCHQVKIKQ